MTKNDFIQMAALQMCGTVINPDGTFEEGDVKNIVESACELASEVEESANFENEDSDVELDGDSLKTILARIADAMEKPEGATLSVFQEMVMQNENFRNTINHQLDRIINAILRK